MSNIQRPMPSSNISYNYQMPHKYKHAVLGGTFDHLHAGHQHILQAAFDSAQHVTIGITSDRFVKEKELSNIIQPHNVRMQTLEKHLSNIKVNERASYEVLDDIFGTAAERNDIDSIVVTSDSKPNAHKLNDKRAEHNLPKLQLIHVSLIKDRGDDVISSTRIRQGAIDRNGAIFMDDFTHKRTLPQNMREDLRSPLGEVMQTGQVISFLDKKGPTLIITIGDIVTKTLRENDKVADIEIIDYRTRREDLSKPSDITFDTTNPAGTISADAVKHISDAISQNKPQQISVDGEEDLLALPAIQLAPLGSIVLYGQFDMGVVVVEVNEEMKKKVADLISKFM